MRIINLKLTNFQGIRDAGFAFNGANADVYGDNATGKTTLFNAVTWLLFGKASTGAKNFSPKTKGEDGDLHYLDHAVEAVFRLHSDQQLTLKKVFKEEYKKVRGSTHEEFKGHVVDYYIDGVPSKEKDYNAALEAFIGKEENIKMLMMPDYFAESMPWEQRRGILLDMCGDITDEDVLAGNPDMADLREYLTMPGTVGKYYTVDEYKKIATGKCKEINRELQTIPARIDEAQKAIPDVSDLNLAVLDEDIATAADYIERKEKEKRDMLSGDGKGDAARRNIADLQTRLAESRAAHAVETGKHNETMLAELNRHKAEKGQVHGEIITMENELSAKRREHASFITLRENLVAKWHRVNEEQWAGDETCPTCLRPLPAEEIANAREQFNLTKSTRLEAVTQEGKQTCSQEMIDATKAEIATFSKDIQNIRNVLCAIDVRIKETESKIQPSKPFEETTEYLGFLMQISALQNDEANVSAVVSQQVAALEADIAKTKQRIDKLNADKANLSLAETQRKRIAALANDEKRLSGEYDNLQRGVYLCEEFTKAKVSMLTDKINGKFESVRFRLFIEQINGGIKEDCEVMVPGDGKMVPYAFANNAARINAGLDIINALSLHFGISVPVFVDNAESVTRLQPIDGQRIRLVVSEADKALRTEVA